MFPVFYTVQQYLEVVTEKEGWKSQDVCLNSVMAPDKGEKKIFSFLVRVNAYF